MNIINGESNNSRGTKSDDKKETRGRNPKVMNIQNEKYAICPKVPVYTDGKK